MVKSLFRISISLGLIGMGLGIFMGIRQDFALVPAHAHLNLLGFVVMFLSALYYRAFPKAAASRLAPYQVIVSIVGALAFPIGIACVILGGHERFEPVVVAGALTVLLGMALFALIVFRTADAGGKPAELPTS
jgi:drug/metabolite transporter (DMT)-like permease